MGWKDSGDCVVYPDGSLVKGPKALCELRVMFIVHGSAWPRYLMRSAMACAQRSCVQRRPSCLNGSMRHFGMTNSALCLRARRDKKKVLTIASNAGHCLWSGIVPRERAKIVVERLMAPDMWTGWGIRTLSASNPAYNPYNYQTGSVWPHDNGIIAMGFKTLWLRAEAGRIAHDISIGASHFLLNQLPELYTAFPRDETTFPVQYIGANVPQAWAAGSIFMLTQAMLGFLPDAPRNKLYVDPLLPNWLPDITISDLRLGRHKFDIRFWREGERTEFEVLNGESSFVERCEMGTKAAQLKDPADPI